MAIFQFPALLKVPFEKTLSLKPGLGWGRTYCTWGGGTYSHPVLSLLSPSLPGLVFQSLTWLQALLVEKKKKRVLENSGLMMRKTALVSCYSSIFHQWDKYLKEPISREERYGLRVSKVSARGGLALCLWAWGKAVPCGDPSMWMKRSGSKDSYREGLGPIYAH